MIGAFWYRVGIFECLDCHEIFESSAVDEGPEACPFCGREVECQRIDVRTRRD
jgi:rRNA maturation endonuclease Nob1